jgi:cobyrinic acid a,c-diamide synthase
LDPIAWTLAQAAPSAVGGAPNGRDPAPRRFGWEAAVLDPAVLDPADQALAALEAAGASGSQPPLTVAIASDRAFHFRYPEADELLRAVGLDAQPWSPLADEPLPPGCRAVILPGGYPELHAAQLAASRRSLGALTAATAAGLPILAECGGLLLLGEQLHDAHDQPQPMAGVLPFSARRGALSLGYRQAEAISDGLLVRRGELLAGHEFHRWQLLEAHGAAQAEATDPAGVAGPAGVAANQRNERMTAARRLWQLEGWGSPRRPEGWTTTHIHATWLHLHWAGCPVIPWRLAAASASAAPLPRNAALSIPRPPAQPR